MDHSIELSFATKKGIPKNAYKSSVKSKNIDRGVDVQEIKNVIAEQVKRNYVNNIPESEIEQETEQEGQGDHEDKSQSVVSLDIEEEEKKLYGNSNAARDKENE